MGVKPVAAAVTNDDIKPIPTLYTSTQLHDMGITTPEAQAAYHQQCLRIGYRADKWYLPLRMYCPRMEGIPLSYDEGYALLWYIRERQRELRDAQLMLKSQSEIEHDKSHRKERRQSRQQSDADKHDDVADDLEDKENVDPRTGGTPTSARSPSSSNTQSNTKITIKTSDEIFEEQFLSMLPDGNTEVDEQAQILTLRLLRERIKDLVLKSALNTTGFLISIDGISPTDAAMLGYKKAEAEELLRDNLSVLSPNERDSNTEVLLWHKAMQYVTKLQDDKDVIEFLSYSYKVRDHLIQQLQLAYTNRTLFDTQLIFREYLAELPVRSEQIYRLFINERQLTAASQRYGSLYYADTLPDRQLFEKRLQDYYTAVGSKIPYEQAIADVLITDEHTVVLLDIKPFDKSVDAGCFHWQRDEKTLLKGPYKLRMLEAPLPSVKRSMHTYWQRFIDRKCKHVKPTGLKALYYNNETTFQALLILLAIVAVIYRMFPQYFHSPALDVHSDEL